MLIPFDYRVFLCLDCLSLMFIEAVVVYCDLEPAWPLNNSTLLGFTFSLTLVPLMWDHKLFITLNAQHLGLICICHLLDRLP